MRRLLLLWRVARQDFRLLSFAIRHPGRPAWLVPLAVFLAFFAMEPLNFAVPVIGVVDDFVILPLLLHTLLGFLPAKIRTDHARQGST